MPRQFASEAPIQFAEDDKYSRRAIVSAIIDSINNAPTDRNFVIGIQGAWGAGKTSIINLVVDNLNEAPEDGEEPSSDKKIIIHTNPWVFSKSDELTGRLLSEISASLTSNNHQNTIKIGALILEYCSLINSIPAIDFLPSGIGTVISIGAKVGTSLNKTSRESSKNKPVHQIRKEIDEILLKLGTKLVIIVDDIDRLDRHDICEVMRFVRAVCDFPNTVFLMAFDRDQTAAALDERYGENNGHTFLEKIINQWFDVPDPRPSQLQKVLLSGLANIDTTLKHGAFDQSTWNGYYSFGVSKIITTPRNVNRYLNHVSQAIYLTGEEIAFEDILAVESIRTIYPDIFAHLRLNANIITSRSSKSDQPILKKLIADIQSLAGGDSDAITYLIKVLFPHTSSHIDNVHFSDSSMSKWRKELRLCHPDIYSFYLHAYYDEDKVSFGEFRTFLEFVTDKDAAENALLQVDDNHYLSVIERMEDYEDEYPSSWIIPCSLAILNSTKRIIPQPSSGFDFGAQIVISRVIYRMLKQIRKTENFVETVIEMITQSNLQSSKAMILEILESDTDSGESWVSEEHLKILRDIVFKDANEIQLSTITEDPFFSLFLIDALKLERINEATLKRPEILWQYLHTGQSWATSSEMRTGKSTRKLRVPIKFYAKHLGLPETEKLIIEMQTNQIIDTREKQSIMSLALDILREPDDLKFR